MPSVATSRTKTPLSASERKAFYDAHSVLMQCLKRSGLTGA